MMFYFLLFTLHSDGWPADGPAADGWMVRAGASDPPPSLALATRPGGHTSQCTLTLALCHLHFAILHFAICTLPFCRPKSDPESASDSTRVRGFLTKWFKMGPEMDPTMCSSEPEIWQSARMAESPSGKVPKWQSAQRADSHKPKFT